MRAPRPRPLVRFESARAPEEVTERFAEALRGGQCPLEGTAAHGHVNLLIGDAERHVWSPWLSLEVRPRGDGGSLVTGRFGPHPHIWTGFMFVHFAIALAGLVGASFGVARWVMDEPAWALGALPAAVFLHAFVYGAEFIGKGLGSEQMFVVRDFVRDTLGDAREPAELSGAASEGPARR